MKQSRTEVHLTAEKPSTLSLRSQQEDDSSSSSRQSILSWLSKTSTPKVTRKSTLALAERDSNAMSSHREESPSKKRKLSEAEYEWHDDFEATPRPTRHGVDLPSRPPPSSSPTKSSRSTQSQDSQRPKSPVKRITDMLLRPHPIVSMQFDDPDTALPVGLTEMHSKLRRFARGLGVISESCRVDIISTSDRRFQQIDDDAFTTDQARDLYGPSPHSGAINKILRLAKRCHQEGHSEASWNGRVHTAVLDLALYNDEYLDKVDFLNCTTAQIQPKSLIQSVHAGKPTESKMIDFAIYIDLDKVMLEAMRAMAARNPDRVPSVNHTWHTPLQTRPISVNIETKRTGEGWDTALVQSAVWVAAQFTKLEQLIKEVDGDVKTIPFLPIIVIQGHDWYFLAASRGEYGGTCIWGRVCFGTTETALGVYQITTVIQYLAHWTKTVYRPWFLKNALGIDK